MILDDSVLDTSYALYHTQVDEHPHGLDETSLSTFDNGAATQLADFSFDMASVLDVEDIYHATIADKHGKLVNHSMLAAILNISSPKQIVTKTGQHTEVIILSLGDSTAIGFEMAVWGLQARFVTEHLRRLDIVFIQRFVLSIFNNVLSGTSRQSHQPPATCR